MMTTEQREKLREVLIDYLQLLTSNTIPYDTAKVAQLRLIMKEVA